MKKFRRILALALSLLLAVLLCACGGVETEIETERGNLMKAECKKMVEALIANDMDSAYKLFVDDLSKEEFEAGFADLAEYVKGVESFELTQTGWYTGTESGLTYCEVIFRMDSNAGIFRISAIEVDGYAGLYSFQIVNESEYENYTGTIDKMAGASPFQWGMIICSVLCFGFVVWMTVDCLKRRIKYKVLWVALILWGAIAFTVVADSTGMDYNIGIELALSSYSYLQVYAAGMAVFNLKLPVGAVAYLIFRKKCTEIAKAEDEYKKAIYSGANETEGETASVAAPAPDATPDDEKENKE